MPLQEQEYASFPPFVQTALRAICQRRQEVTSLEQIILLPNAEVQSLTNLSLQNVTKMVALISAEICNHCNVNTVDAMHRAVTSSLKSTSRHASIGLMFA